MSQRRNSIVYLKNYQRKKAKEIPNNHNAFWENTILLGLLSVGTASLIIFTGHIHHLVMNHALMYQ